MTPSSVGSELQSGVIEPRKKMERGSLRGLRSGGNTEAPQRSGVEVRPGSKSSAKQHWGLRGSWESLLSPRKRRPDGIKPVEQDPGSAANFRPPREENRKRTEVSSAEPKAKAQEKDRGSLSITIVATESRETNPKKPVSSQGRCRVAETAVGNIDGTPCPWIECHQNTSGSYWVADPQLEEPDALITLVRFCGGRRPTFGPDGPIPDPPGRGQLAVFPRYSLDPYEFRYGRFARALKNSQLAPAGSHVIYGTGPYKHFA
jgi:hypothetical protein